MKDDAVAYFSTPERRPMFCVTTGRSGTQLLANSIHRCMLAVSLHEPSPGFQDIRPFTVSGSARADLIKDWWITTKLPAMYAQANERQHQRYVETSHVFCKGFAEMLIDIGIVPDIIVLRRDPRETAQSLFRIGTIPWRNERGKKWCMAENDDRHLLPGSDLSVLSDYQLCYLYCLEIEAKADHLGKRVRDGGGKVCSLDFREVVDGSYASRLARELDLKPTWRARLPDMKFGNKKVNAKLEQGMSGVDEDLSRAEEVKLFSMLRL